MVDDNSLKKYNISLSFISMFWSNKCNEDIGVDISLEGYFLIRVFIIILK